MDSTHTVMRSKMLPGNSQLEEVFYFQRLKFEENAEIEAKKVFKELLTISCNILLKIYNIVSKTNTISLKFLKQIIDNSEEIKISPIIRNFITVFKLTDQLKLGNKSLNTEYGYDFQLTENDFIELFTGKYIKDILFDSRSLEKKRHYIEEYSKLYELLGGDERGLSKRALFNCLKESLLLSNANNYSNLNDNQINKEVDDIIANLGTESSDYISLNDFVNIMTTE